MSDKYLTERCGILAKLLPGDIVLADCGFDVANSVECIKPDFIFQPSPREKLS